VQVGSLNHQIKGQHILFQALSYLMHNKPHHAVTLDLIGAGCSEAYLRQLSADLKIEAHVRFVGLKTRDYIYDHLCDYDILVQPSLSEGFGLTVIEGMAARIPVLVSNIDGPMEIVQQGCFGHHFKVGDPVDCAEKLEAIISGYDSETFQSGIAKAYHNALTKYNINSTVQKYYEIYSGQTGAEFNA
jgi:glycosyltransferase involved in cell wall biosynthesis